MQAYADVIRERSVPCFSATDEVISILTTTVTPQGVIAVSPLLHRGLEEILQAAPAMVLVANRVRDPGNLGNMIRIADAVGVGGMVVCAQSADVYNPKTVRSTAGSMFHIPMAVGEDITAVIESLKRNGYTVLAADAHAGEGMWDVEWPQKMALVMGNEAWGIPQDEEVMADALVRVDIFGEAESLNVSAAAAVLLYEAKRQQIREK